MEHDLRYNIVELLVSKINTNLYASDITNSAKELCNYIKTGETGEEATERLVRLAVKNR